MPPRAAEPGEAPGQRPRSQAPGGNCGRLRGPLCRASPVEAPDIPALDHGATLCRPLVTASSRSGLSGGGTRPAPAQPPPFALGAAGPPTFGEGPALGAGFQHPPHNPRPSSKHCLVPASACRPAALGLFLIKQALPGGQCGVLAFTSHVTLGSEGSQARRKTEEPGAGMREPWHLPWVPSSAFCLWRGAERPGA